MIAGTLAGVVLVGVLSLVSILAAMIVVSALVWLVVAYRRY